MKTKNIAPGPKAPALRRNPRTASVEVVPSGRNKNVIMRRPYRGNFACLTQQCGFRVTAFRFEMNITRLDEVSLLQNEPTIFGD
jgi:hypothetical protein